MAAYSKWLVKFHCFCATPKPSQPVDMLVPCVTLSFPPWTVVVHELWRPEA